MEFEFYNVDGSYISNVIVNTAEELLRISLIYNKRPIVVDMKTMRLKLVDEERK